MKIYNKPEIDVTDFEISNMIAASNLSSVTGEALPADLTVGGTPATSGTANAKGGIWSDENE
jgi:hypothetical protein